MKNTPSKSLWETEEYYKVAHEGSLDLSHPGMVTLKALAEDSKRILDLGCGDGTRLSYLSKGRYGVGIDTSKKAISLAKEKYKEVEFIDGNIEKLPFKDASFDLVYSAFVLEHLTQPEVVLNEAIRVTAPKGKICLVAPNFGAPNRASPSFKGSRLRKLFKKALKDLFPDKDSERLDWDKVTPILNMGYKPDYDTTIEPYLGSLMWFFRNKGLTIRLYSSCWSQELGGVKLHQKIFRVLGEAGIYPFSLWGPHLLLVVEKK